MTGVVQGGWPFVIAAYSVTAIGFLAYGISLFVRLREGRSAR